MDRDILVPSLKFPQKLWHIINKCESGAISWSSTGCTILLDYTKFQNEYLSSNEKIFKTNNITSFIRQLNMYGFRKVASHKSEVWNIHDHNVHEFVNENFQLGRLDLLEKVCRKTGTRNARMESSCEHETRAHDFEVYQEEDDDITTMTELQACQIALKDALNEATIRYEAKETRALFEEAEGFDYEKFKFYFAYPSRRELESITLYIPKITDADNRDWYSEAMLYFISVNFNNL